MFTRINEIFTAALEMPQGKREQFLDDACKQDQELRAAVERLLESSQNPDSLIATGGARQGPLWEEICSDMAAELLPHDGERVGPYRLLREIGWGGMGVVYLGERADGQFDKQVALKLLKLGIDTKEVVRRFRQERQILASLEHPGVVRLLDGGVTEDGRPYFAMEYVDGKPIDQYCDEHRLTIDERLQYFIDVAEVVQHAHQNLVVHRDLKPSNIFINDRGEVRLLDFGIAKLLNRGQSGSTAPETRTDVRVMTPEYASPEQIQGGSISIASDVYQLGLLLNQLLTGQLPYRLSEGSPREMERAICEVEAMPPSMVVAGKEEEVAPTTDQVARARRSSPERLHRKLRGDLDSIVLKAIRKEPGQRYATVEQLLQDIRRYLSGLPVLARKGTFRYRFRKLAKRHALSICSSLGVLLVIAGLVTFHMLSLAKERDRAQLEAAKARQIADFLGELFKVSDPNQARGEEISARQLVDRGAQRIANELGDQPEVQSEMMAVLGTIYCNLGLYEQAAPLLQEALEIRRELPDQDPAVVVSTMNSLGTVYLEEGRYAEAEPLMLEAIEIAEQSYGPEHPVAAGSYLRLGNLYVHQGKVKEAGDLYQRALAIRERELGPEHPEVTDCLNNLAGVAFQMGQYDEAEPLFRRALEIRSRTLGSDHPGVAEASSNLAAALCKLGKQQEAEPLYHNAKAIWEKALGPDHPLLANVHNNLGALYGRLGRVAAAESHFQRTLELRKKALGDGHPRLAMCLTNVAIVQSLQGRYAEAEERFEQALEILAATVGSDHPTVTWIMGAYGSTCLKYGRYDQAESLMTHVCGALENPAEPDSPQLGDCLHDLALLRAEQGTDATALPLLERAMSIQEQGYQPEHDKVLATCNSLAVVYTRIGRYQEAEALYRRVLTTMASKRDQGGISSAQELLMVTAKLGLGDLLQYDGETVAARTSWNEAFTMLEPINSEARLVSQYHLHAITLLRLGRADEAMPLIEWLRETGWRSRDLIEQCGKHQIPYGVSEAGNPHYRLAHLKK
jgi:serine/threonine-protein kinase